MTSSCSPFLSCSGLRGFCRVRAAESMATNSAAMGIVIAAPLFLGRLSQGRCQRLPPAFGQALRTTLLDPRKTCQPSSRMAHGIRGLHRDGITPVFRRGAQVPASIQAFDHVHLSPIREASATASSRCVPASAWRPACRSMSVMSTSRHAWKYRWPAWRNWASASSAVRWAAAMSPDRSQWRQGLRSSTQAAQATDGQAGAVAAPEVCGDHQCRM